MSDQLIYHHQGEGSDFTSLTVKYDGGIMYRKAEGKFVWSVAKRHGEWISFGTRKVSNGKVLSLEKVAVPRHVMDEAKREIRAYSKENPQK